VDEIPEGMRDKIYHDVEGVLEAWRDARYGSSLDDDAEDDR